MPEVIQRHYDEIMVRSQKVPLGQLSQLVDDHNIPFDLPLKEGQLTASLSCSLHADLADRLATRTPLSNVMSKEDRIFQAERKNYIKKGGEAGFSRRIFNSSNGK